jgi:transcriptional regulator with XRE-family HTH domain
MEQLSTYKLLNIHYKIKKIRELRNLTVKDMAYNLKMTSRAYSYIETGKTHITLKRLCEIVDLLNCSVDDLINFDPSKLLNK